MPELTVDFDVYCGTCGAGLCGSTSVTVDAFGRCAAHVAVCEVCMEKARDEGYEQGYRDGEAEKDGTND